MNRNRLAVTARAACATIAALALAACGSGTGPGWTYAPLGPTPSGGAVQTPGPTPSLVLAVATNNDNPLIFVPSTLEAPAATVIQVNYLNNSSLPHNINFFNGPDNSATTLGATKIVTGPNAPESVTFTTPQTPGSYYFWCDVHFAAMSGTLRVQ